VRLQTPAAGSGRETLPVVVEWHAESERIVEWWGRRMGWCCLSPGDTGEDSLVHALHVAALEIVGRRGVLVMITHGGRLKLTLITVANKD
jgi:hypothetical protein